MSRSDMMINDRNALACTLLVKDEGPTITIELLRVSPSSRTWWWPWRCSSKKGRGVLSYLVTVAGPGSEKRRQSPRERARCDDSTMRILCACCTSSYPINWGNSPYVGPAAIANARRIIFDRRDEADDERFDVHNARSGARDCHTAFSTAWGPRASRSPKRSRG